MLRPAFSWEVAMWEVCSFAGLILLPMSALFGVLPLCLMCWL